MRHKIYVDFLFIYIKMTNSNLFNNKLEAIVTINNRTRDVLAKT